MTESTRTQISYDAEAVSDDPLAENVTITNNSGKSDKIYICGLAKGDTVKLYSAAANGKLLSSSTVGSNKTDTTLSISQLGSNAGSIYVSIKTKGMRESNRVKVDFSGEGQSEAIDPENVTITNNSSSKDAIYISGLASGDKVKVYTAYTEGKLLGTSSVSSNSTETTLKISQLGTDGGNIYISVTSSGMTESSRVKVSFSAEGQTDHISSDNVTVTNNSGETDTVYVTGLSSGDKINIYNAASDGRLLGSATAGSDGSATANISQLGTSAGSIYISLTSSGLLESSRVKVNYDGESQSSTLDANNITVTNNSGKSDTVYVSGLAEGEVIKVYSAAAGGTLLGKSTVASDAYDTTVTISQLGTSAGKVYVSMTDSSQSESDRVAVSYASEEKSSSIDADNVVITNNPSGTSDTVYISDLSAGDIVKVYNSASGGTLLGTATLGDSDTSATVSINQLGTSAGSVYISLTSKNKGESSRTEADYSAESKTSALNSDNIVVTNNVGAADTVQVSGVSSGQIINVYSAAKGGNLLGTATVASGATSATVSISQLGSTVGSVYVSLTDSNKLESDRAKTDYSAESTSDPLDGSDISVTNRSGSSDIVSITGASQNDVINVYDLAKGGTLLGTATVAAGETKASISITQLGTNSGSIYVSRTGSNKSESIRVKVDYDAEPTSTTPSASNIIVANNAGINDTVEIKGLSVGDLVQVYDSAAGGTVLGSATVASNVTSATVSIAQLGTSSGNIYVSTTSTNKSESSRTQVAFSAETQSVAPNVDKITILNNAGVASTIKVSGLTNGDRVNVYDSASGGTLLGTAAVSTYGTSTTVSVTQLGENAGNVYVSVTSTGKLESDRTEAAYSAKTVSTAPNMSSITVTNNASKNDTVEVTGLKPNDIINVYDAAAGGNLLGTETVDSSAFEGTVTISQLGSAAGTLYVSVTSTGKTESSRIEKDYSAESQSDPLDSGDVTIENNAGTSDTITVTGLSTGDVVKIYSTETGGSTLGTATVTDGKSQAAVTISQLGTSAGTVYVSVTRSGYTESSRTAIAYLAESTAPVIGNISIVNNAVISDTITVKGLTSNDIVKVYDASTGGNLIGTATVSSNGTQAAINVSQLSTAAGNVYISVTNLGKNESSRTRVDYVAEN